MKTNHALTALVLCAATTTLAQDQPAKEKSLVKPIASSAFYVSTGHVIQGVTYADPQNFKALAPQSVLLNDDLTGFQSAQGWGIYTMPISSVGLGLKFWNKERTEYRRSPELRISVMYGQSNPLYLHYSKTETSRYDTLSSSQTNTTFYMDSVKQTGYSMSYNVQNLYIDLTAMYRTNPLKRWSLYTGLSCAVGGSINAYTSITRFRTEHVQTTQSNSDVIAQSSYDFEYTEERFKNKGSATVWANVPMGIDFRIGRKRELLKHVHVYYEARPGLSVTEIPGLETFTSANLNQSVGIKVNFDNTIAE